MKKLIKILATIVLSVLLLAVCLLTFNDHQPLEKTDFYPKTIKALNNLKISGGYGSTLKSGWSKENISPDFDIYIAGYGIRKHEADSVHDSIYVRTIVFDNGKKKIAMVAMDLLIVPPLVTEKVVPALKKLGFAREDIYLGATHSHSSAGGWAAGLGGRAMAGPENPKMINKIAEATVKSVKNALQNATPCKIGFQKINAAAYVANRLWGEQAPEDPYLRVMKVENTKNESALLVTYSAHATCISKQNNSISCDYPGMLAKNLEKEGVCNFAGFFAGAVGSMRPTVNEFEEFKRAEVIANDLDSLIRQNLHNLKTDTTSYLSSGYLPLLLRDPQLRVNDYLRIRPWVFNWLMGKQSPGVNSARIGDIVWIGTPCDYSGEMVNASDSIASLKKKDLFITSFNGAYIGYITPDVYYDSVRAETREMNWFGPYNGRYFKEVVNGMLTKTAK